MSDVAYDARMERAMPEPDGLVGHFDLQLDRLEGAVARLSTRLQPVLGPESAIRGTEPELALTPARERVRRLSYLIDALNEVTERVDL